MHELQRLLNLYYLYLMLDARSFLGQYPRCFCVLQNLSPTPRVETLVAPDTDLCIEAPSGSGNSFFVNGFRQSNPGVSLAHHHHVAAQVARGVRFEVPTVVILRDPIACVVSRASFWNAPCMIGPVYRQWIRFFRSIERFQDDMLIARFESVTRRPREVVEAINNRFDTHFNVRFPDMEQVAGLMHRVYVPQRGEAESGNPNLPSAGKELAKARFRSRVREHRLARPARAIYTRLARAAL